MKQFYLVIVACICMPVTLHAQGSLRDSSINLFMISPGYALQIPGGDLSDRFGVNSNVGLNVSYKQKNKWIFGIEGNFIFGSKVKQPGLFSHLVTSQGDIIGTDGRIADVRVFERGYIISAHAGKMIKTFGPNPNSGFFINTGAGYIRHKIRVEDKNGVVPALQDDYKKGYDRMTDGFCLRQSVGYIYISNRRLANFFIALEATEGFTKGRRTVSFDDEQVEGKKRIDILTGLRIGWILPVFKAAPEKFYFN